MSRIEMDFQRANRQADSLEELASELGKLAGSQFEGSLNELAANWKGDNANAFLQKGARLEENMKQTAKSIKNTAIQLRRTAKLIYDAEMYAKKLAEKREYGGK